LRGSCFFGGALATGIGAAKLVQGYRVTNATYATLCTKIVGGGLTVIGLSATLVGKSVLDAANSSISTRKYIELAKAMRPTGVATQR
jgi:Na+/H+ antiporter NhaD/arsenite permease-like protein